MILKVNQLANQIDCGWPIITMTIRRWTLIAMSFPALSANGASTCRKAGRTLWTALSPRRRDETRSRCWRRIRISICGKIFALACWSPRRQFRAIRKRGNSRWITSRRVRAYYDTDDATTKAFLDEVDKLSQQSITMTVPETLQSRALLEKLMQTRVRNLMAQPAVTAGGAPSPAPAAPAAPLRRKESNAC